VTGHGAAGRPSAATAGNLPAPGLGPRAMSAAVASDLRAAGLDPGEVSRVVSAALAEDLAYGPDVTTQATVPADAVAVAQITPRVPGVLAGAPVALAVFDAVLGGSYEVVSAAGDGSALAPGRPALVLHGAVPGLLTAERTALNFLCHLCGIATATARWVAAVAATGAVVRDSRKTLPGLRALEKYAVRCGGGTNHRMGLGDSVLIKDNHIQAAGSVTAAITAVRARAPGTPCEVEVDNLAQLDEALRAGAAEVLLDNFTPAQCAQAVRRVRAAGAATRLEASGGLTLERARAYAEAGVDYLAVGALTHSSPSLDLGMDLTRPAPGARPGV
jgi:nicotinate-nucleotide pyrophosphorylase (carboxylating)